MQSAASESVFGGVVSDKEFQRLLALQQANSLAERKLRTIRERMNIGLGGGIVSTYDVISSASNEELDQAENSHTTGPFQIGHAGDKNQPAKQQYPVSVAHRD